MIIGLNGQMGVGKSTAANHIATVSKQGVKIIKFAAPLYDMQEYIYRRINTVHMRSDSFVKDRTLLQWLGTEWGRGTISPTIWVDLWKHEANAYKLTHTVICDDVRFDNEAQAIRDLGGIVINIKANRSRADAPNGIFNHSSERPVSSDLISRYIHNDGTEKEFESKLTALLVEERVKILEGYL